MSPRHASQHGDLMMLPLRAVGIFPRGKAIAANIAANAAARETSSALYFHRGARHVTARFRVTWLATSKVRLAEFPTTGSE